MMAFKVSEKVDVGTVLPFHVISLNNKRYLRLAKHGTHKVHLADEFGHVSEADVNDKVEDLGKFIGVDNE